MSLAADVLGLQTLRDTLRTLSSSVEGQRTVNEFIAQNWSGEQSKFDADAIDRGDIDQTIAATLQMLAGADAHERAMVLLFHSRY